MQELNNVSFPEAIKSSEPIIIDFWATWCGPCQMLTPVLEDIATERGSNTVFKVNVDDNPDLAAQFGVSTIPTMVVFKDSKELERAVGVKPKGDILALLDRHK